jgi:CBS domain-containing protein
MKVKETMTRNPEMIRSGDSVIKAAEMMKKMNIGAVPVSEDGGAVGILTDRDIALRLVAEGKDAQKIKAGEIMSKDLVFCMEDEDVKEAAKKMEEKQIRRLMVKDSGGRISGIVSLGDIALSLGQQTAGEVLQEVSKPSQPNR